MFNFRAIRPVWHYHILIEDKRLSWPDTMSWGPGGALYVTASQIQFMPRFNNRKDVHIDPYKVFKVTK